MEAFRRFTRISKKGSLIVDAAIILPVFILAMAAILSLIKTAGAEETAYSELVQRAEFKCESIAALNGTDYEGCITDYSEAGRGLIKLKYRPWTGEGERPGEITDLTPVWIFPKYGERYHKKDCYYVQRDPSGCICTTRGDAENSGRYTPCLVCGGS